MCRCHAPCNLIISVQRYNCSTFPNSIANGTKCTPMSSPSLENIWSIFPRFHTRRVRFAFCLSSLPILDNHLICSELHLIHLEPRLLFLFFFFLNNSFWWIPRWPLICAAEVYRAAEAHQIEEGWTLQWKLRGEPRSLDQQGSAVERNVCTWKEPWNKKPSTLAAVAPFVLWRYDRDVSFKGSTAWAQRHAPLSPIFNLLSSLKRLFQPTLCVIARFGCSRTYCFGSEFRCLSTAFVDVCTPCRRSSEPERWRWNFERRGQRYWTVCSLPRRRCWCSCYLMCKRGLQREGFCL